VKEIEDQKVRKYKFKPRSSRLKGEGQEFRSQESGVRMMAVALIFRFFKRVEPRVRALVPRP
jgi:hypothetical protein